MGIEALDFKLRKLFVVANGLELSIDTVEFDDLFYALLDEVEQLKELYEINQEAILNKSDEIMKKQIAK